MEKEKMNEEIRNAIQYQKDSLSNLSTEKTDIEKIITSSKFQYNIDKSLHLGMHKDEVLYEYTYEQMDLPETYKEIESKLSDKRVGKLIFSGHLIQEEMEKILHTAKTHDIPFTIVDNPDFKGEIALEILKK